MMKISPFTMAVLYFFIGGLLIFFAIQNVSIYGWNLWSYLIIAFATTDFMISIRFFRLHRRIKKEQNK